MTEANNTPALQLSGISSGYGRFAVLRDVDLTVEPGQVVALLGANGAGKTTLMRTASGLIKPTQGKVMIDGADLSRADPHVRLRSGLCHIPEGRGIYKSLTVRENLRLSSPPWAKGVDYERVTDVFPRLGARINQIAGSLSGGEQQMLSLGRAFLCHPKVVMLDEVSLGLAPLVVDDIFRILRLLVADGVGLLVVEQYIGRALALADQVYLIKRGHVTFAGPASEVAEDSLVREYMGVEVAST